MKKIKNFKLFAFALLSFAANAQDQSMLMGAQGNNSTGLINIRPYEPNSSIEGTQYYRDVFFPATVSTQKGSYLMRYNAAKDDMEFKKGERQIFILNKSSDNYVITFNATNEKYALVDYKDKNDEDVFGYLKEISNKENVVLYKRERISYVKPKYPKNGYDDYTPAKFKKLDDEYYIKHADGKIVFFPKNKKKLIEAFPDKKGAIETFLKDKNPSFKTEEGLKTITEFLATL